MYVSENCEHKIIQRMYMEFAEVIWKTKPKAKYKQCPDCGTSLKRATAEIMLFRSSDLIRHRGSVF